MESSKISMLVDHEKNALCDGYIVEFIHDATENYYEGGTYAELGGDVRSVLGSVGSRRL